jgi:hypothetical protein
MKVSNPLIFSLMAAALILQGCATTGGTESNQAVASTQSPAAAPATQRAGAPMAAVPEENGKPVVKADSKENFEAVVAAIHKQMEAGGRWQFINATERSTIDGNFADMQKLYDQYGSVDKMDTDAKVRLLADQSSVNAILTQKDGDRLICQTELPVGSHLPVKTCKTYAQMQMEQRGAQQLLHNIGANSPQLKHAH